jgi:tetratricopeptide (TPR) repeat protein
LMEQPKKAIELSQRAQRLQPKNIQALETLAIVYQSMGDKQKAIHYYDKAVEIEPRNVMLLFGKSRAINAPAPREYIVHVESVLRSPDLTDQQKGLLHFSLAWLYEKSDADVHFRHLKRANAFIAVQRQYSEGEAESLFEQNIARFSKASISALQQYGNHSVNPIFIAALPRSGSTLLENMLGAHTEAYRVGESGAMENALNMSGFDLGQFGTAASPDSPGRYPDKIAAVAQYFLESRMIADAGHLRIVDKSISNYSFVGAILMVFPNAKIINLRRHPLDIIYSCYQQHFASGHNYTYSLSALAEIYAVYVRQMAFWEELFPHSIFSLSYENLVSDPAATLKELLEFCDLPWQSDCLDYHSSLGTITTASDQQVRKKLYRSSVQKWQRVESHLQPVVDLLGELADYDPD